MTKEAKWFDRAYHKESKPVATNRKARHEYDILETYEAGLVLLGTEVKSLRSGRASLKEAYAGPQGTELFLFNTHIAEYAQGNRMNHNPTRPRKLLLHKKQVQRLLGKVTEKGLTLVPLQLYFKNGYAKVLLAVARGKRQYDRRKAIKEREIKRELQRIHKGLSREE